MFGHLGTTRTAAGCVPSERVETRPSRAKQARGAGQSCRCRQCRGGTGTGPTLGQPPVHRRDHRRFGKHLEDNRHEHAPLASRACGGLPGRPGGRWEAAGLSPCPDGVRGRCRTAGVSSACQRCVSMRLTASLACCERRAARHAKPAAAAVSPAATRLAAGVQSMVDNVALATPQVAMDTGPEGLVIKGPGEAYQPGQR
jgi:hypothetical protein